MSEPLTQRQLLAVLQTALTTIRDEVDPDITVNRVLVLLAAATEPGVQQMELGRYLKGTSNSGISRNVLDLTEVNSYRKPGPGLVMAQPDPSYRKRHLLYLTPKGHQLLNKITQRVAAVSGRTA